MTQKENKKQENRVLFGTSGIRGKFGEQITPEMAVKLGRALGEYGAKKVVVGRDTRVTGKHLKSDLFSGLLSFGCSIMNLGIAPTPVVNYGVKKLGYDVGVMITASHNPADYNGFKVSNSEGISFSRSEEEKIEAIFSSINSLDMPVESKNILKDVETYDMAKDYSNDILKRFSLKGKLKVLIDPANGAAFKISPFLLTKFGYPIISVNDEEDGTFPNRLPEPSHVNLQDTAALLRKENCDVGFCHDGDADRVMTIDEKGNVVDFDTFLAWICKKTVEETGNKKIVTTVDASMVFEEYLPDCEIHRTKVGDVFVSNKCKEIGACFGGEPSGSYIFPEWGLWPDGIYGIFKFLKFLEEENKPLSEILAKIPKLSHVRKKVECPNDIKKKVMEALKNEVPSDCTLLDIDGIRITFENYIVMIRPSGTEPYVRINVESKSNDKTNQVMDVWFDKVSKIISDLRDD